MNSRIYTLIMIAALAMTAACTSSPQLGAFTAIDPRGWAYGDTVRYCACDSDSAAIVTGDIVVVVRNSNSYEYSNIWLRLDYADGDTTVTDTLNVKLADDFGNWYGKGIGISYQRADTVARNVRIDPSSDIKLSHIMRVDTLQGIEQIGIILAIKGENRDAQ